MTLVSEGSYELSVQTDEAIGVEEGQRLLLSTAVRLCGGVAPHFGRYRFSRTEGAEGAAPGDAFALVQEIVCGGEPAEEMPPTRALTDQERSELEQVARDRTESYLGELARGDYEAPYAMLGDFITSTSPFDEWRTDQERFRADVGRLGGIDVWKVTVYADPPGAPRPGIYVATDLEVSYEKRLVCGYYMWLEGQDGILRIIRQDVRHIDGLVSARMSESQLARVKTDFRCRPDPDEG